MSDKVLEKEYVPRPIPFIIVLTVDRKTSKMAEVFSSGFSISGLIDALADVYNGVSSFMRSHTYMLTILVHLLVNAYFTRRVRLV